MNEDDWGMQKQRQSYITSSDKTLPDFKMHTDNILQHSTVHKKDKTRWHNFSSHLFLFLNAFVFYIETHEIQFNIFNTYAILYHRYFLFVLVPFSDTHFVIIMHILISDNRSYQHVIKEIAFKFRYKHISQHNKRPKYVMKLHIKVFMGSHYSNLNLH